MASTSLPDPYLDESTGILRNLVGATTQAELSEAEASLSLARLSSLIENPPAPTADLRELRAIHQVLFQDVYDWAGKDRIIDLRKLVPDANVFAAWQDIDRLGSNQSVILAEDGLLSTPDIDQFSRGLAKHYEAFNYLHPFREGNGRAQRLFWDRISLAAGWSVDWSKVGGETIGRLSREAGNSGNIVDLVTMFKSITARYVSPMSRAEQRRWLVGIAFDSHDAVLPAGPKLDSSPALNHPGIRTATMAPIYASSGRCGKPRTNGKGFCMRRVSENGCPYHG
jgi:cell filamentation protein